MLATGGRQGGAHPDRAIQAQRCASFVGSEGAAETVSDVNGSAHRARHEDGVGAPVVSRREKLQRADRW